MNNQYSLTNFGDLSKPVTILIEKLSDAAGVLFEPTRITNKAKADAKADEIKTVAKIKTTKF